ncbi:MAG: ribbon-helix-helix protein, CopG family [Vicinamibacterales bacterium]|jgi:predicted transcriptional regulator|nr:ribbon-helix-helix protein, CopG family [Vicinamibacterales bacterium]
MASVKLTFSLDEETVARLRTTAGRVRLPQSQVVREAIAEYAARVGRLSEDERAELLRAFDRLLPAMPSKAAAAVDAELRELRAARRRSGRRLGQR